MKALSAIAALAVLLLPAAARPAVGAPVVIAVVDSGVNGNGALASLLVPGHNALDGSADTRDGTGHGTAVAGVIASVIAADALCNQCRIMPVKIGDEGGATTQAIVAEGIQWAAEHGARVVNLSYGLAVNAVSTGAVEGAVAAATRRGTIAAIAALNDGSSNPSVNLWASQSPDGVRVAAVDQADRLQPASNHGVWVEIGAPAGATSGAAPRVAAVAALVLAAHPELSAPAVKAAIRRGCKQVPNLDVAWHCVLDAEGAIRAAASAAPLFRLQVRTGGTGDGRVTDGGAIDCGAYCRDTLDKGSAVTLKAVAARDSRFTRWQGGCTGLSPTCSVTLAADTTALAVFARVARLTVRRVGSGRVTSSPAGIVCGRRCSADFAGPVVLLASPGKGHRFLRWQGVCRGTRPRCRLVLQEAGTAAAVFR